MKSHFLKILFVTAVFHAVGLLFIPMKAQTVLNNDRLRMGTGAENSVNASGNLQQPFYYNSVYSLWRKLTYSSYPLDNAYAIDGDKTYEWNTNGTILQNPSITGQVINTSGYVSLGSDRGYGTIVSTGQINIAGKNLEIENIYTLPADKSFIEVKVKVTNLSSSLVENVRIWIGTRDDWVGSTDQPTKQKGNLIDGEFVKIPNAATRAAALKILSGDEGVLFYTNSNKGNTITQNCCSWINVITQNPETAAIEVTNDGSYGFYVRFNDLPPGASDDFTWYYAAGELADLEEIIEDVAEISGAVSNITYTSAELKATSTLNATGYWMVINRNSTAPTASQIKSGSNYGSVTVVSSGSGAMTANIEKTFNITGLSAGTAYDLYFVSEDPSPAFSDILRVEFSTASYSIPVVSSTRSITSVTGNGAVSGGTINNDGGQTVLTKGVCWSTGTNPTLSDSFTNDGEGTGSFESRLSDLSHSTTYYVRAYATNSVGTAYGPQLSFTTLTQSIPTLSTAAVSVISQTSATSGGNVTSDGGLPITSKGICWNTSGNPDITGNHTSDGEGSGSFSTSLSGLEPGITYYLRAYATNILGINYGGQISFTTLKYAQSVSFAELPAKTFGDADFEPDASASSGLPVAFSSDNVNVATVVDNKIHIIGAGVVNITANQPGNSVYNAAVPVEVALIVNKADQTVSFPILPLKAFGDPDFNAGASSSSLLDVAYASSDTGVAAITGSNIRIKSAGTTIITASQSGDANYNAAESVDRILTVEKSGQLISFPGIASKVYGDPDFKLVATASSMLPVSYISTNFELASVSGDTLIISGAGVVRIIARQEGNADFEAAPDVFQDITINKSTLTITIENQSRTYGEENPVFGLNFSGFISEDTPDEINELPAISTQANASSNCGDYAITLEGGSDENYDFNLVNGILTVNKAELVATADNKSRLYGEDNPLLSFSFSGFKNEDSEEDIDLMPIPATSADKKSSVGDYSIDFTPGDDNNYQVNYIGGNLTVNKKPLMVKAEDKEKMYGALLLDLSITYEGFVNDDDVTDLDEKPVCSVSANTSSDAGIYEITVSGGSDKNYEFEFATGNLEIKPAKLIVTAIDTSKVYGDPDPDMKFVVEGLVNNDSVRDLDVPPTVFSECDENTDAGQYRIIASGGFDRNYEFEYLEGRLTICRRNAMVRPENVSKVYGATLPEFSVSYSGLINGDTKTDIDLNPAVSTLADQSSPVGEYELIAEGAADNNYEFEYESGTMIVTPAELIVAAVPAQITYGEELPELLWITEGFVLAEDESVFNIPVAISTEADPESDAGEYAITVEGVSAPNYNITYQNSKLSIGKAQLEVFTDEAERAYSESNPEFSIVITGFVNNDDESELDVVPEVTTPATQLSSTGEYPINISGGRDQNYIFNYHPSVLTVNKANQNIEFENIPGGLKSGETFELTASASSGLPVEFSVSNERIASIDGVILRILLEGEVIVNATQEGDENWNPVSVIQAITTLPEFGKSDYLMSPNGDGINDRWHINFLDEYGIVSARVYNRWGKLVFESDDYSNDWDGRCQGKLLPAGSYYFLLDSRSKGTIKGVINILY